VDSGIKYVTSVRLKVLLNVVFNLMCCALFCVLSRRSAMHSSAVQCVHASVDVEAMRERSINTLEAYLPSL
jgi:hypothetical protein